MTEMSQLAIECNIITLLKLHPDPNNFIAELRNAAIDNAFHELTQLENATKEACHLIAEYCEALDKRVTKLEEWTP